MAHLVTPLTPCAHETISRSQVHIHTSPHTESKRQFTVTTGLATISWAILQQQTLE